MFSNRAHASINVYFACSNNDREFLQGRFGGPGGRALDARTGKSRGPSDRQKNGNTASKVPLNSLNNDSMDFPLPALSMPRPEIPPGGSPDARAMSQRRVRRAI